MGNDQETSGHEDTTLTLSKPRVGPHHYVFKGFSGMPETLKRKDADAMLQDVLGLTPVALAVNLLKANPQVLRKGYQYSVVKEHLEGLTKSSDVPLPAIVALWAKALYNL